MTTDSQNKGSKSRTLVWALILLLLAVGAYHLIAGMWAGGGRGAAEQAVPVLTVAASREQVDRVLNQSADIRPLQEVYVVPKVKGQLMNEILVDRGDAVEKGQLLLRLDKRTVLAKKAEVEASLMEAKAAKSAALARQHVLKKDQDRLRRLAKTGATAQQNLDHIIAEFDAAKAQADLADANIAKAGAILDQLDIVIGDHDITAPISGLISGRYFDKGSLSDDKKPIFKISDESRVKVLTSVSERDYPMVRVGQAAAITVDAYPGQSFVGKVSVVSPNLSPATRSADIEVEIDNPDLRLRSGMFADVAVRLGRRQALLVPLAAVQRQPGTGVSYLFVVNDGKAVQQNVRVGEIFGDRREILGGLESGAVVVVRGAGQLVDGQSVTIQKPAE